MRSAVPRAAPSAAAPAALHRPPGTDIALMALAVSAVSTSGPLIAATAAPTLAIAFWRNTMASAVLVPWSAVRVRGELRALSWSERRLAVLGGAFLAAHFATWVPSVTLTSVSSATALVATQPIWAALIATRRGQSVSRRAWVGIGVAVVGVALVTGVDVSVSVRALSGDLLALAGAVLAAAYVSVGGEVRRTVSTTAYTTICYATAAVVLLAVCLIGRQHLGGYSANAWVKIALLTAGAQLLGHSVFNRVLRTTSATVVSLSILFEVPGATVVAALWLHQYPHAPAIPGLVLLLVGLGLVIGTRPTAPAMPAE